LPNAQNAAHNFLRHITLYDDLIQPLRVLAHATAGSELLSEELGHLLEVETERVEAVDRGYMFPFVTFLSFDCYLMRMGMMRRKQSEMH
jgi:hypothetical protein